MLIPVTDTVASTLPGLCLLKVEKKEDKSGLSQYSTGNGFFSSLNKLHGKRSTKIVYNDASEMAGRYSEDDQSLIHDPALDLQKPNIRIY